MRRHNHRVLRVRSVQANQVNQLLAAIGDGARMAMYRQAQLHIKCSKAMRLDTGNLRPVLRQTSVHTISNCLHRCRIHNIRTYLRSSMSQ